MPEEPRFRSGDIRWLMDVYTFDGAYLGNVLWIRAEQRGNRTASPTPLSEPGRFDGEAIGPMPTQALGNTGPHVQSGQFDYATGAPRGSALEGGSMLVGKYFGLIGRHWISLDDVQTVSLERVILRTRSSEYV